MTTQFQKKAGRRWPWRSPDGNTKNEIDYIMTGKPSTVTDVTVINRVNIGSDHRRRGSAVVSTSACHAGGRGSLLGPGTLLDVKTWLSTLEIVYLCVFRMRH